LRPPFEISYVLVRQKNGHYHVRITAGNATPIIVGGFPSKREAEAWLEAEEHDAGDLRDSPSGN
jgi:uncharacterized protein YegP (UPF0339 family)